MTCLLSSIKTIKNSSHKGVPFGAKWIVLFFIKNKTWNNTEADHIIKLRIKVNIICARGEKMYLIKDSRLIQEKNKKRLIREERTPKEKKIQPGK